MLSIFSSFFNIDVPLTFFSFFFFVQRECFELFPWTNMATIAAAKIVLPRIVFKQFDVAARGEAVKALLAIGGFPFEEEVIQWDEWLKIRDDRSRFPQGTLPVMHVGDTIFGDSFSSLAFAAKAGNFVPEDPMEFAHVAQIQQCLESIYTSHNETNFSDTMREGDQDKKRELRAKWTDTICIYFSIIEQIAINTSRAQKEHRGEQQQLVETNGPFAVGSRLSVADVLIYNAVSHLQCKDIDYFDDSFLGVKFPRMVSIKDLVFALPAIEARRASGKGWQR